MSADGDNLAFLNPDTQDESDWVSEDIGWWAKVEEGTLPKSPQQARKERTAALTAILPTGESGTGHPWRYGLRRYTGRLGIIMTYLTAEQARIVSRDNRPASEIDGPLRQIMESVQETAAAGIHRYIDIKHKHGALLGKLDAVGTRRVLHILEELGYEIETSGTGFPSKKYTTRISW